MANDGYNGWSNYETWNCALWLDNDDGEYQHWREQTLEALRDADGETLEEKKEDAAAGLAKALESYIEDNAPEVSGLYSDILSAGLNAINYYEIAEHWLADCDADDAGIEDEDEDNEDDEDDTK